MRQSRRPLVRLLSVGFCLLGLSCPLAALEIVGNGGSVSSVSVYSDGAADVTAPIRTLVGASTQLAVPNGIAADVVNSELYVANNSDVITVYSLVASGNTAPTRMISGLNTGLMGPVGIAVDTVNDEIVVANFLGPSVTVYARTANGNASSIRTISGATTGLNDNPSNLFVDLLHNEIVVSTADHILVFDRLASGDTAPLRDISGGLTGIDGGRGIFVDLAQDEILLASRSNTAGRSVTVYSRTANGNVAPLRTIAGASNTGLGRPLGLTLTQGAEILVVNDDDDRYAAFSRTANGDVSPTRVVSTLGGSTGLDGPGAITSTRAAGGASAFVAGASSPASAVPVLSAVSLAALALALAAIGSVGVRRFV